MLSKITKRTATSQLTRGFFNINKVNRNIIQAASISKLSQGAKSSGVNSFQGNMNLTNSNSFSLRGNLQVRSFAKKVVVVPGMGDSISEGVIEEFVKQAGEYVEADEIIARIETDKVTVDIPSPEAGVIQEYFAAEGDTVEVGANFYSIDTDATSGSAPKKAAATPTPQPE